MSRTVIPKQEALELLRRWATPDLVAQAQQELPDPIDLRRDQELLARYGMTRGQMMDRAGSSP